MDDTLDALSGAWYFSSLGKVSVYWQVPVIENDKCKTGFTTAKGLYEFNTKSFGLSNVLSTFQPMMEIVLAGPQWKECVAYMDDVIVYASSFEERFR